MIKRIASEIKAVEEAYQAAIDRIAEKAKQEIVPIFNKKGWSFISGNGSWFISDANGSAIDGKDVPKRIRELLEAPVYFGRSHLGEFMEDI